VARRELVEEAQRVMDESDRPREQQAIERLAGTLLELLATPAARRVNAQCR
jgi:hypothetical protein